MRPAAAPVAKQVLPWPEKPVADQHAVKRLDGPDKVTGRAQYTYDINRPGMIYGKIVRSPHPHARIVSIDTVGRGEGARREGGARLKRSPARR